MRRIGTIATALLGLYVIASAITLVGSSAWFLQNFAEPDWSAAIAVAVFIAADLSLAGFGIWLVAASRSLSEKLFDDVDMSSATEPAHLLRIGVILIGLTLLSRGSIYLANGISYAVSMASWTSPDMLSSGAPPWGEAIAGVVISLLQVGFGALFVWRSERVAGWLWRLGAERPEVVLAASCPDCGAGYNPDDYQDLGAARCDQCGSPLRP